MSGDHFFCSRVKKDYYGNNIRYRFDCFTYAVKRYHFQGGQKTHGASDRVRAPGSRGSTTTPGRVYKGARGPGHMGDRRITTQNIEVVLVDAERHLIGVNGAVPGSKGSLVEIKATRKM